MLQQINDNLNNIRKEAVIEVGVEGKVHNNEGEGEEGQEDTVLSECDGGDESNSESEEEIIQTGVSLESNDLGNEAEKNVEETLEEIDINGGEKKENENSLIDSKNDVNELKGGNELSNLKGKEAENYIDAQVKYNPITFLRPSEKSEIIKETKQPKKGTLEKEIGNL